MKRLLIVLTLLLLVGVAQAAATLQIDPATPPVLGQPLNFLWPTDSPRHRARTMVEVACTQPVPFDYVDANGVLHTQTNALVYDEIRSELPFAPLGGGGSVWLWHGGPAECTATLFYYDHHSEHVVLASTIFHAEG